MSWVEMGTGGNFSVLVKDFVNKNGEKTMIIIGNVSPKMVFSLKSEQYKLGKVSDYFDKKLLINHNVISENEKEFYWEDNDVVKFMVEDYEGSYKERMPIGIFFNKEIVQEIKEKFQNVLISSRF